mgnify:CR=1 FL=1
MPLATRPQRPARWLAAARLMGEGQYRIDDALHAQLDALDESNHALQENIWLLEEQAETIETGSRAAALGGFTCVVAMPNTDPTQDSVSVGDFVRRQGELAGLCDVRPAGSITIADSLYDNYAPTLINDIAREQARIHALPVDSLPASIPPMDTTAALAELKRR